MGDEGVKVVGRLDAGHLHRGPERPVAQDATEDGPPDLQRAAPRNPRRQYCPRLEAWRRPTRR